MGRRRRKSKQNKLGPVLITQVNELFESKKWDISDEHKHSLYNRFINTLVMFENNDQRKLFLRLSQNFKYIDFNEYKNKLVCLLEKAITEIYDTFKLNHSQRKIYIMPLKTNEDRDEIKSSDCISYLCKGTNIFYSDILYSKKFEILGSIEMVKKNVNTLKDKKLFLIDDFIGTANYASKVIDELTSIAEINKENIIVLSIYMYKKGYENLKSKNIKTIYLELLDDNNIKELDENELNLILSMEKKLNVEEDFSLGYEGSGCLISLIRTPNNTLPIFWMDKSTSNAPFPRR